MDTQTFPDFVSNSSLTPSSIKSRPKPSPSIDLLEDFNLNDLQLNDDHSRKNSSQRLDKPILVIEYLEEKLKVFE